jgi:hypothetical protein
LAACFVAATLTASEVKYVSEIPPARHPQLVYWFWQTNTLFYEPQYSGSSAYPVAKIFRRTNF